MQGTLALTQQHVQFLTPWAEESKEKQIHNYIEKNLTLPIQTDKESISAILANLTKNDHDPISFAKFDSAQRIEALHSRFDTTNWQFDHLAFNAENIDALQEDFTALLDLESGYRPDFPFPGYWLYKDERAVVHIITNQTELAALTLNHIAFRIGENTAKEVREFLGNNGLLYQLTRVPVNNNLQFFISVPGANFGIELIALPDPNIEVDEGYQKPMFGV